MTAPATPPREFIIVGLTTDGKPFRPSDWAERLAGAMSCFGPDGVQPRRPGPIICYSPFCVPALHHGVRSVRVSQALEAVEPMAWQFVMDFARDNRLQVVEAVAEAPEPVASKPEPVRAEAAKPAPVKPAAPSAEPIDSVQVDG